MQITIIKNLFYEVILKCILGFLYILAKLLKNSKLPLLYVFIKSLDSNLLKSIFVDGFLKTFKQ